MKEDGARTLFISLDLNIGTCITDVMALEYLSGDVSNTQLQARTARRPSKKWWFLLGPLLFGFAAIIFIFVEGFATNFHSLTKLAVETAAASLILGAIAGLFLRRLTMSNAAILSGVLAMACCAALMVSLFNALESSAVAALEAIPPQPGFPEPLHFPEVRTIWWIGIIIIAGCCLVPHIVYLRNDGSALFYLAWYASALFIFVVLSLLAPTLFEHWI